MARRKYPKYRDDEPLDIYISFAVRTGKAEHEKFQLLDNQRVPMVGTAFENRDRAVRFLAVSLVKVAALQTNLVRHLLPMLRSQG